MHIYERAVHFYETDLMGIVHHSNYIRFVEEARVSYAFKFGLLNTESSNSAFNLAVLSCEMKYLRPAKFADKLKIQVQAKLQRAKLIFEYKVWDQKMESLLTECRTSHSALNAELKAIKPPIEIIKAMEKQKWIETWLLNL